MAATPPDLIGRAARAPGDAAAAARILPLVDLTSLGDDDTEAEIETLCTRAIDAGVAAACVWPRFLPVAKARLAHSPIRLATVANFPDGSDDLERASRETAAALAAGAQEVDVVAPIQAILDGDIGLVTELVQACRKEAPEVILKVILETGRLAEPARIAAAARAAIMGGCDMLKTSTAPRWKRPRCCSPCSRRRTGGSASSSREASVPRSRRRSTCILWISSSARGGRRRRRFDSVPRRCLTTC